MKKINQVLTILTIFIFVSCKKEPGIGGDASIKGKVINRHYNTTFTTLLGESEYADTYVYIIFGDKINYGQRIKTNYKGEFEFEHLYKGTYHIYTYSLDSTAIVNGEVAPTDSAVVFDVNLTKRKEQNDLGNIVVFR